MKALTDTAVKSAKPGEKRLKLYDTGGLYLAVEINGSKLWRMRYRFAGKHKLLSFGPYPQVYSICGPNGQRFR